MQAVVLAAGQSSRLFPFGGTLQKAGISLMGRPLIVRTIENLRASGVDIIIVVVSPENGIKAVIEEAKIDLSGIRFVSHMGARGMGEALLDAAAYIVGDFFLLHAHHLECDRFIPQLTTRKRELHAKGAIVVREDLNSQHFGIVRLEKDRITEVVEKPDGKVEKLRIVGMYFLPHSFLDYLQSAEKHHYSFETALNDLVKQKVIVGVQTDEPTLTLKYPWHILDVGDYLLSEIKAFRSESSQIAQTAILEGEVFVSDGVVIEENAVIKGPCFLGKNVYVGNNAIIRNGVIVEEDAKIGANLELKHSIIMAKATTHSGFIGDSIIGPGSKIAAFFCTGNVRIDRKNVEVSVKDQKVDTGKKSLGVFVGENVKLGIRVSTMPGILIGENATIGPSTTIFKNISPHVSYYTKFQEVIEKEKELQKHQHVADEKEKTVLFDIDYTLFDTDTFKKSNLRDYSLYGEVVGVLGQLASFATLGIFSEGTEELQQAKLLKTAIEKHFAKSHTHIVQRKDETIEQILQAYKDKNVFLVDDKLPVLARAKELLPSVYTIWIKRGPFASAQKSLPGFSPDATVEDLSMVLPIVSGV